MESQKYYIEKADQALLHTYNRYQVVLEKGDGVYLYDVEGKEYLVKDGDIIEIRFNV